MIVDSHCHLDFPQFQADFSEVLSRAAEMGVTVMQSISTKISTFPGLLKVVSGLPNVYCSLGVHPSEVSNEGVFSDKQIIALAKHPKVIGIGETGLDFYYNKSGHDEQIISFRNHISAARILGLPVIIHTRDAEDVTLEILRDELKAGEFKALIHCFTGSEEFAKECLRLGFSISFSGIVTFKNAQEIQRVVSSIPLSKILVETDAPYLSPAPKRGQRNEPAYTRYVVEFIAQLRGVSVEEISNATTNNFFDLFSKAERC